MSRIKKAINALVGDKCDNCAKEASPSSMNSRSIYKVSAKLNHKLWNKELKRYLFVDPSKHNGSILVVESQNVDFERVEDMWRITDALFNSTFDSITITKLHDERIR